MNELVVYYGNLMLLFKRHLYNTRTGRVEIEVNVMDAVTHKLLYTRRVYWSHHYFKPFSDEWRNGVDLVTAWSQHLIETQVGLEV